jgi:diguanylate cyclase (GGDEF)-like protein
MQNILLLKQLEELAIRDPLTGLYNKRQMQISLDNEIERSKRYGHAFGVLIMDIDHFKNINDTYGHLFGDHILKKLGTIMQKSFRATDQTFRYGGEEFLVILSETNKDEAALVVDRFMDSVRSHTFISDEQKAKITISIGASFFPFQSTDKLKLIKLADRYLYQAKAAGRDRVVFCDTPEENKQ